MSALAWRSHARIRSRDVAQGLGFDRAGVEAIATAVSELARNIVVHASHGEIVLSRAHARGRQGLVVVARDRGPGIENIALAMGCGLPGAQRLVDKLEIATELGVGTVVRIEKWLP